MKKRVSLQERVKQEKDSAEKFEQGFKTDIVAIAAIAEPRGVLLTEEQGSLIKALFHEYKSSELNEDNVNEDLQKALELSASIKSVIQQSVLLVGERVKKAQALMARYRVGMFNKWLFMVFGNKVTPYSFLNYYNFYNSIEDMKTRSRLEELPKKAAYKLASRKGELSAKIEVLNSMISLEQSRKSIKTSALEKIIDQRFPVAETDNRTAANGAKKNPSKMRASLIEHFDKIVELSKVLSTCPLADADHLLLKNVIKILDGWSLELGE